MGVLSNLLHLVHGRPAHDDPAAVIRPAKDSETELAVRLVLGGSTTAMDEEQVQEFLTYAPSRGIDLSLLWVAEQAGRVTMAALPVQSPGRTMLIFTPRVSGRASEAVLSRLIDAVCRAAAQKNIHLAQILFDPAEDSLERIYTDSGFVRMAELLYLQGTARASMPPPALPPGFCWLNYSIDSHAAFARTILATYQDSLDCPALNGLRDIEDILDGHKASGEFDPANWFLLREHDAPRGVLLLSPTRAQTVELVYLGLPPEARGRGLGELMIKQAMAVTARTPYPTLSLAVDAGNVPALKLYYRQGLNRVGVKVAYMRDLRPLAP